MAPSQATAPGLAAALGRPVSNVEHKDLSDGNKGALSAMCKIHLEFPEENEMTRELSDVVIKAGFQMWHKPAVFVLTTYVPRTQCPPSGVERLFTDPWDMFRKEVNFYNLVAKECPIRTPKW